MVYYQSEAADRITGPGISSIKVGIVREDDAENPDDQDNQIGTETLES